jgi:flagellar basal body-associated protein FliL
MRQDAQRQPVRRSSTEADVKNGLTWAFIVVVMVAFALLLAVLMWLIVVHAITPP